jgi:hypothetical protein
MTVRAIRWATGCVAAISIALVAGGLPLLYVDRNLVRGWNFPDVFEEVTFMAVPVVGFVLASRRPANRIGWIFLGAGLVLGLGFFCYRYGPRGLVAAPGSLPAARAAAWFLNWAWDIPVAGLIFILLLFPTGRLLSRRWRPAMWFVAAASTVNTAAMVARACRVWADPFTAPTNGWYPGSHATAFILLPAALLVGVAAVVVRFARSSGDERLQLKWFAAAAVLVVAATIPLALAPQIGLSPGVAAAVVPPLKVVFCLAFVCLFAAIAVAVLKYRLYDIDIVISKTVQYGALAVFITAVYAGLVAGVGTLAGDRRSPLLSAFAAVVVALAFQPVRQRAGRLANRLVYGQRASPYQVLSEFARRVGGGYAPGVLPQMASTVAAGTGAERVVVWLRVGAELRAEAASDGSTTDPLPVNGQEMPSLPDTDFSAPVVYQDELLGAISIRMPRDEPLNSATEQLVDRRCLSLL